MSFDEDKVLIAADIVEEAGYADLANSLRDMQENIYAYAVKRKRKEIPYPEKVYRVVNGKNVFDPQAYSRAVKKYYEDVGEEFELIWIKAEEMEAETL